MLEFVMLHILSLCTIYYNMLLVLLVLLIIKSINYYYYYYYYYSFLDYETLRTTGVILATIMFVAGILIALSKYYVSLFHISMSGQHQM